MSAVSLEMIEQGSSVSLLTTELNSLANNTNAGAGPVITNVQATANLNGYKRGKVQLKLAAYTGTPTAGSALKVWFLRTIDAGTTYEDGSSSVTPARNPDVTIGVGAITSGPQVIIKECDLPVGKFKTLARNDGTGITFASSGNTLDVLANTDQGV